MTKKEYESAARVPLTGKEKLFVQEYMVDLNAPKAAERAHYSPYVGGQLMSQPNVQVAISIEMEKRLAKIEVTEDRVLTEIARLAFSNVKSFLSWSKNRIEIKDSDSITDEDAAAIASVTQDETIQASTKHGERKTVRTKFTMHNKTKALELLAKYLGMLDERIASAKVEVNMQQMSMADASMNLLALEKTLKEHNPELLKQLRSGKIISNANKPMIQ